MIVWNSRVEMERGGRDAHVLLVVFLVAAACQKVREVDDGGGADGLDRGWCRRGQVGHDHRVAHRAEAAT